MSTISKKDRARLSNYVANYRDAAQRVLDRWNTNREYADELNARADRLQKILDENNAAAITVTRVTSADVESAADAAQKAAADRATADEALDAFIKSAPSGSRFKRLESDPAWSERYHALRDASDAAHAEEGAADLIQRAMYSAWITQCAQIAAEALAARVETWTAAPSHYKRTRKALEGCINNALLTTGARAHYNDNSHSVVIDADNAALGYGMWSNGVGVELYFSRDQFDEYLTDERLPELGATRSVALECTPGDVRRRARRLPVDAAKMRAAYEAARETIRKTRDIYSAFGLRDIIDHRAGTARVY